MLGKCWIEVILRKGSKGGKREGKGKCERQQCLRKDFTDIPFSETYGTSACPCGL